MDLITTSQSLLKAVKNNQSSKVYLDHLSGVDINQLVAELDDDDKKKTFWINTYNAFVLLLLRPNPKVILNVFSRISFFSTRQIHIARYLFSLNDIEHTLLRKSQIWWGRGYVKKLYTNTIGENLQLKKFDLRIHFALNCGANGCPPIRYYELSKINQQLELATEAYIFSEIDYDVKKEEVYLPRIFLWYIGDFGGEKGIINFLKKYNALKKASHPQVSYLNYDWKEKVKVA